MATHLDASGQHFVANALDRYNIRGNGELRENADGLVDIYSQPPQGRGVQLFAGAEGHVQSVPAHLLTETGRRRPEMDVAGDSKGSVNHASVTLPRDR